MSLCNLMFSSVFHFIISRWQKSDRLQCTSLIKFSWWCRLIIYSIKHLANSLLPYFMEIKISRLTMSQYCWIINRKIVQWTCLLKLNAINYPSLIIGTKSIIMTQCITKKTCFNHYVYMQANMDIMQFSKITLQVKTGNSSYFAEVPFLETVPFKSTVSSHLFLYHLPSHFQYPFSTLVLLHALLPYDCMF